MAPVISATDWLAQVRCAIVRASVLVWIRRVASMVRALVEPLAP